MEEGQVKEISDQYSKHLCEDCKEKIQAKMEAFNRKGNFAKLIGAGSLAKRLQNAICVSCRARILQQLMRRKK